MKGVVFKELIGMVESAFGEEMVEKIIEKSNLDSRGAYTSVGTYDHSEILQLVTHLSKETKTPAGDLVQAFGKHLVGVFKAGHPDFFKHKNVFEFLKSVDGMIHVEVKKLYPDAELPKFECEQPSDSILIMDYSSARPFADLAEGLIAGAIEAFGEDISMSTEDTSQGIGNARKFILERK